MSKKISGSSKKSISVVLIIAIVLAYIVSLGSTKAQSSTNTLSVGFRAGNNTKGKVQYSLDDGATWNDITDDADALGVTVTGDNLRIKLVPNADFSVDYAGIELTLDGNQSGNLSNAGFESANGYSVPANVQVVSLTNVEFSNGGSPGTDEDNFDSTANINLMVSGVEIENPYGDDASEIRVGVNHGRFVGIAQNNATNTYTDVDGEQRISTVTTNNPLQIGYNQGTGNTVVIGVRAQWNTYLTDVIINETSFANDLPKTKDDLIAHYEGQEIRVFFEVPKAANDTYNVTVTGRKQTGNEVIMGNFLWNYDPNSTASDDDKIPNAKLEFVKAKYNGTTYNSVEAINALGGVYDWNDAERKAVYGEHDNSSGSATFPVGTELTVKLIPDEGYQLTSFGLNGNPFEPGEQPCVYTFTITGGNFHLEAKFTQEANEVVTEASSIKQGKIVVSNKSFNYGTARLEITDVEGLSAERTAEFESTAAEQGYNVEEILDLSLYNTVYKGGLKDNNGNYESWDTPVENLNKKATVTLQLEEGIDGKDVAIVHETHEGAVVTGYEVIDAAYSEAEDTVTFEADGFSNYAIVSKVKTSASDKEEATDDGKENDSNAQIANSPKTGDLGVIMWVAIAMAATAGIVISRKRA